MPATISPCIEYTHTHTNTSDRNKILRQIHERQKPLLTAKWIADVRTTPIFCAPPPCGAPLGSRQAPNILWRTPTNAMNSGAYDITALIPAGGGINGVGGGMEVTAAHTAQGTREKKVFENRRRFRKTSKTQWLHSNFFPPKIPSLTATDGNGGK